MSILEIKEGDTVLKLWAATVPDGDFLALLKTDGRHLEGMLRVRWHAGPGFDANDRISRFELPPRPDTQAERDRFLAMMRALIDGSIAQFGMIEVNEVDVNGGPRELVAALMGLPGWAINIDRGGR